jgi:hypothetical protein
VDLLSLIGGMLASAGPWSALTLAFLEDARTATANIA